MADSNAYIVPLDDGLCLGKGPALVAYFEKTGLIDGFDDEELGWYTGGASSVYPDVIFEYIEVYDSKAAHFIPSGTTEAYDVRCPGCRRKLDKTILEMREDWPTSNEKKDMSRIVIKCPHCEVKTKLKDLKFATDTAMTRFYVMLADSDPSEWNARFIPDVERVLGCKTRIVIERL